MQQSFGIAMRLFLLASSGLVFLSTWVSAEETKPVIDLSTEANGFVVEEEYQSIRPGAMDERFAEDDGLDRSDINLSYDDDQPERDEYGIIREIEGPATTDYSKPPESPSNN
ncbi:MAG: hypothetical protein HEP70_05880 [Rhodobiaceae bacterium]|nr:hypothetical protein [Rhodobiaceae bacterium]